MSPLGSKGAPHKGLEMRYLVVKESNQTWAVFDKVFGVPAQMHGKLLVGLTRHNAKREASKANELLLQWRPGGSGPPPSVNHPTRVVDRP